MKIIFFGLGSIGRRHAEILSRKTDVQLYALRTRKSDCPDSSLPVQELFSWEDVDRIKPDIAFITNPTMMHIPTAIECAKRGMAIFLEKPLGGSLEGLDELLSIVNKNKVVTYVAYLLRFSPIILKLKEMIEADRLVHIQIEAGSYLPSWRPGRNHKLSYSAWKEMGGGVVFDLSHEIDYVHFLTGGVQSMSGVCGRVSDVTVDSEDFADIDLKTLKAHAHIHLSFFSHMNQRKIKIDLSHQSIVADLLKGTVECYQDKKLTQTLTFDIKPEDLYNKQIDFFLSNINNPDMMNNVSQASELFRKIYQFRESAYAS